MLSIYSNLSAGAQNVTGANVTGAYIIIALVYRLLVNNTLTWQSRCVIANTVWHENFTWN